jgi:hypothetical protein
MAEHAIDRAIAGVVDGMPVDWSRLEKEAGSEEDRGLLRYLRILGGLADLHHSTSADAEASQDETVAGTARPEGASVDEGQRWGRYQLVQKVGDGGFGSVYRAWDPELEREVAIKILHRRVADARLREGLLREGRALARVRDPHVVSVLGIETHDDQIALCMEFVHGETLEDSLHRHGTLNAREASLVGEDVCRALAAVHLAGFVHRDVKARNVMRETAGRIVLMDFGAGQQAEDLKVPGKVSAVGTPPYMAPEVLAGQPASVRSDVYSVGILLYRLVTGEYPIEGKTPDELRAAHMQGQRRLLSERRPDLPAAFIRVVDRALAADPAKRYVTAAECLEALASFVHETPVAARSWWLTALSRFALTTLSTVAILVALGAFSTTEFNHLLGRSEFAAENPRSWLIVGLRSTLAPAALLLLTISIIAILAILRRVLVTISPHVRNVDALIERWRKTAAHGLRLDDPATSTSLLLLVSAVGVLGSWWYFQDLLASMSENISTAEASYLRLLSPDNLYQHDLYREVFVFVTAGAGACWYIISKLAPKRGDMHYTATWWGAAALFVFALGLLEFPYRVLRDSNFDAVTFSGADCYVLGERRDEALLFCPDSAPPRSRIVKKAAGVEPTGRYESIFSRVH